MSKKLTNVASQIENSHTGSRLDKPKVLFKLCIDDCLENGYSFQKMNRAGLKDLDDFINQTIGKNLTISQVDKMFLRTKGSVKVTEKIKGIKRDILHYGKNRKTFRVHGYYNENGYFVLTQIDPKHRKYPD